MIAFASLLEEPARQAGIPVPKNSDCFNAEKFPRFELFCKAQLGRAGYDVGKRALGKHQGDRGPSRRSPEDDHP